MAIGKRKISMDLIFHSDRGIQYASKTIEQAKTAVFDMVQ
jgi:hypothetical protein